MKNQPKLLWNNQKIQERSASCVSFYEFNGKKFRICFLLRNGEQKITTQIMDNNGVFHVIFNRYDIDFDFTSSYLDDYSNKRKDIAEATNKMLELITTIYK